MVSIISVTAYTQEKPIIKSPFNDSTLNFKYTNTAFLVDSKLILPEANFMAVYNKSIMNYDFYPSVIRNNFQINSCLADLNLYLPNKIDSFNPYGVYKPQEALFCGMINLFLENFH